MNNLHINGFLNILFGESQESATEKITQRNGILDTENSSEESLFFDNLNFAGRETKFTALNFVNNKFCRSMVFLQANLQSKTIELYNQIKNEISEKYYVSNDDFENYEFPYEENDGHTETAISLGKANFSCFWVFNNIENEKNDYISIKIDENFNIVIIYENGKLMDEFENNKKQNNFKDY